MLMLPLIDNFKRCEMFNTDNASSAMIHSTNWFAGKREKTFWKTLGIFFGLISGIH